MHEISPRDSKHYLHYLKILTECLTCSFPPLCVTCNLNHHLSVLMTQFHTLYGEGAWANCNMYSHPPSQTTESCDMAKMRRNMSSWTTWTQSDLWSSESSLILPGVPLFLLFFAGSFVFYSPWKGWLLKATFVQLLLLLLLGLFHSLMHSLWSLSHCTPQTCRQEQICIMMLGGR